MTGYVDIRVTSDSLLSKIFREGLDSGDRILYRGQSDASWRITASFDRFASGNLVKRQRDYEEFFLKFKKRYLMRYADGLSEEQLGALAQHYGLRTRFIDWTEKPYIALFFACSPASEKKECAIYRLNLSSMERNISSTDFSLIGADANINARLNMQRGYLLRNTSNYDSFEGYLNSRSDIPEGILTKFVISKSIRKTLAQNLELMGIGYSSLFDGLEYLALEINQSKFGI